MEAENGTKITLVEACRHASLKWVAMEKDTKKGPTSFSSMWPNKQSTAYLAGTRTPPNTRRSFGSFFPVIEETRQGCIEKNT